MLLLVMYETMSSNLEYRVCSCPDLGLFWAIPILCVPLNTQIVQ